jgi:pantetheine-phosphate adenylyltransferase, bacterial
MNKCVYPGSFDPMTFGHLDIIKRSARLFEEVHVAVLNNTSKKCMFSLEERLLMLREETKDLHNVRVDTFGGLLVDYLHVQGISIVVRGVRNQTDMELEEMMANTNRILYPDMETVMLVSNPKLNHISSSIIKELIRLGADITSFVPASVVQKINGGSRNEDQ